MDAAFSHDGGESRAKRVKLYLDDSKCSNLPNEGGFSEYTAFKDIHLEAPKDITPEFNPECGTSIIESEITPLQLNSYSSLETNDLNENQDEDMEDDNISTISNLSDLSGLSDLSSQDWKPINGSMIWIKKQISNGINPRSLLSTLGTDSARIPQNVDDVTLWKIIINALSDPPVRHKLRHINTLEDVVRLLKGSKHIIVLTGAGVSVSCGIPDFRSRDGIYSRLAVDFPDLPDPQAMFDIRYFSQDPRPFFKFAKDIYPGKFKPSPCHRFIKLLEKHNKLLRNYTQNIDTLENVADIRRVVECHGSFATATCTRCLYKVKADDIRESILEQKIPMCPKCVTANNAECSETNYKDMVDRGIMKPDIVFFGEGLPDHFHEAMAMDKLSCDLLIVIGSSLKVRPVALIPSSLPENVPQILINKESLPHCQFDVELLGDCDVIINQLCHMMGNIWQEGCWIPDPLKEATQLLPNELFSRITSDLQDTSSFEDSASNSVTPSVNTEKSDLDNCNSIDKNQLSSESSDSLVSSDSNAPEMKSFQNSVDKYLVWDKNASNTVSEPGCSQDSNSLMRALIKQRHESLDSTQDSGIGESVITNGYSDVLKNNDENMSNRMMKSFWEPKLKHSLASRLPKDSFYLIPPCKYIFPGAEVYYDPDEQYDDIDDTNSVNSDSSKGSEQFDKDSDFNNCNTVIGIND